MWGLKLLVGPTSLFNVKPRIFLLFNKFLSFFTSTIHHKQLLFFAFLFTITPRTTLTIAQQRNNMALAPLFTVPRSPRASVYHYVTIGTFEALAISLWSLESICCLD